jgi:hypothetical protein
VGLVWNNARCVPPKTCPLPITASSSTIISRARI